jgi:hypothetical protein
MAASDAVAFVASGTHGATSIGIVVAFSIGYLEQILSVPGEGTAEPTSRAAVRKDLTAIVESLNTTRIAPNTKGSLVLVGKKMDGSTDVTHTLANMKASEYAYAIDRDSPPARMRQTFVYEGADSHGDYSIA